MVNMLQLYLLNTGLIALLCLHTNISIYPLCTVILIPYALSHRFAHMTVHV